MNIILQPRNVELDDAFREFLEKQLAELDRHGHKILKLTITLEKVEKKKNDTFANQVTLVAEIAGENVVVERHAEDLKVCFVDAVERLDRALRKSKEKRRALERKNHID